MTDIHVITNENRARYEDLIDLHHQVRHDIFVGEKGWEALRKPDGRDVDAYDDEHAVYLLAVDGSKLVGGQRLYPTTRPHMISEVFPHLVHGSRGIPSGPDVMEWTRYFVVRERRYGRTDCRLLAAMQQYCLDEGIETVTAVAETWWLPRVHSVGFKTKPLGVPQMIDGQPTIAVKVPISEDSLASVRRHAGLRGHAILPRHFAQAA